MMNYGFFDTIESMDQAQQQLEQLEREYDSILKLKSAYDTIQ